VTTLSTVRNTASSEHSVEWAQCRVNTVSSEHSVEWTQCRVNTASSEHSVEWTQRRVSTASSEHSVEWAQRRVSTASSEHSDRSLIGSGIREIPWIGWVKPRRMSVETAGLRTELEPGIMSWKVILGMNLLKKEHFARTRKTYLAFCYCHNSEACSLHSKQIQQFSSLLY